jgi:hypothetical protein
MTYSSISFEGDGLSTSVDSEIDLVSSSTCKNFLHQCLKEFNKWLAALDTLEGRFPGNVAAVPEIDKESGLVRVEKRICRPQKKSSIGGVYVGVPGTKKCLTHGSVIALHCSGTNSFLHLTGVHNEECARHPLPRGWVDTLFLVVELGNCHFAFYSTSQHAFLGVNWKGEVFEHFPEVDLADPGVQDEDFLNCIPPGAIFVVQSEKMDGREVSLYSRLSKSFIIMKSLHGGIGSASNGTGSYARAHQSFPIVLVMESSSINDMAQREMLAPTKGNTIQQCFEAFETWKKGLDSFPGKFEGRLVAATREITVVGDMGPPETEIHLVDFEIRVGVKGTINNLATGSVVVLHNRALHQHLEIAQGRVKGQYYASGLCLRDNPFLAIRISSDRVAFYHIQNEEFLVMKSDGRVAGVHSRLCLSKSEVTDELFCSQIPEGAAYLVRSEQSDHSAVSLFSEKANMYLTMNADHSVNGSGGDPHTSQIFQIMS